MAVRDISCAADARYAGHSAAMLHSAAALHGSDLRVHYLHGRDLRDRDRARLRDMLARAGTNIEFHLIEPDRVAGLPAMEHISVTMWHRIFLPELLPGTSRVLYLDVDTIVQDRLDPLWDVDLDGKLGGAVTNVFPRAAHDIPGQIEMERSGQRYFNSGVLLMNLELMRQECFTERLLDYVGANADKLGWPDQDALNHLMGPRSVPLHPRWNVMNSFYLYPWSEEAFGAQALEEARVNPAIRHFEGPSVNKPWHLLCDREMKELYRQHRLETPWARYLPEGITPTNLMRLAKRAITAES